MNTEGICTECKEWTDVTDSCCGALVYVDGGLIDPLDLEELDEEFQDE